MTVNQLRNNLTQSEFFYWAAYYENKNEIEKREMDKAKNTRYTR